VPYWSATASTPARPTSSASCIGAASGTGPLFRSWTGSGKQATARGSNEARVAGPARLGLNACWPPPRSEPANRPPLSAAGGLCPDGICVSTRPRWERVSLVKPKSEPGQVVATPGALAAFERSGESPLDFLQRHLADDWGEVDTGDWAENEFSLAHGFRLLSAYRLNTTDLVSFIPTLSLLCAKRMEKKLCGSQKPKARCGPMCR